MSNEDTLRLEKYKLMTEAPIKRLIVKMAIPTIISMMISSIYNMADTFFVGQINTSATAAVGVIFPLMAIIQAIGFFFGQGSGNYISRRLGAKDHEEASRMAATGFFSAFALCTLLAGTAIFFVPRIVSLLGATSTIQPYAEDYLFYILLGAPFMASSLVLNNQLRLQGNAMYSMVGITAGGIINIALDPLLIFGFKMGIAGAALATAISQFISFCLLLAACTRGGSVKISFRNFSPSLRRYGEIAKAGMPSLSRQGLASIATVALNVAARPYGDAAVAAMSIVGRVLMFATSALLGFGQGFQPVCGFNYGAKRYGRVLEAFWFCIKVAAVALTLLAIAGELFAPQIIAIFRRDDPDVIRIGATVLRIQCAVFPLVGWVILLNMLTQNIGAFVNATVLAFARQGLFFLPLILILPRIFGLTGVQVAQAAADLGTFLLALPMGVHVLKGIRQKAKEEENAPPAANSLKEV